MKTYLLPLSILVTIFFFIEGCKQNKPAQQENLRTFVDTVGFAHYAWQMDSVGARVMRLDGERITELRHSAGVDSSTTWRVAICPHDDYSYAGFLYPLVLDEVRSKTIILFGVAHKAKQFGLEDRIVFDDFPTWKGPYGPVKISPAREQLKKLLQADLFVMHDSMQIVEHSLEALIPWLQANNRQIEILPILVPYMSYERMNEIAGALAKALKRIVKENKWEWGRDYSLVISTDAVHYGDEDWGGTNFAFYGADSAGYSKAIQHEQEIIGNCLAGEITPKKILDFTNYTVREEDYKNYKWTWCGRFSVPFGLLTAHYLEKDFDSKPCEGVFLGYATSIDHDTIPVSDLRMGRTALANIHHWVGYAAIGYK